MDIIKLVWAMAVAVTQAVVLPGELEAFREGSPAGFIVLEDIWVVRLDVVFEMGVGVWDVFVLFVGCGVPATEGAV